MLLYSDCFFVLSLHKSTPFFLVLFFFFLFTTSRTSAQPPEPSTDVQAVSKTSLNCQRYHRETFRLTKSSQTPSASTSIFWTREEGEGEEKKKRGGGGWLNRVRGSFERIREGVKLSGSSQFVDFSFFIHVHSLNLGSPFVISCFESKISGDDS